MQARNWLKAGVLALGLLFASATFGDDLPPSPKPGEIPPQLIGKDTQGNAINLADHRNKVVIVTFWASWCGPCRKELPVLGHFQKTVGRDALEVIAVNFKESRQDFRGVLRANRDLKLTFVHDKNGTISDQYGVEALPQMFIVGHDGKIAFTHRGYSEQSLPGIIDELLSLLPEDVRTRPAGQQAEG